MRWFWQKETSPALSGECSHLWSNWSEPDACRVTSYSPYVGGQPTERDGWAQDRHCLNCNFYERRLA